MVLPHRGTTLRGENMAHYLDWLPTEDLSFNTLLLLERVQLSWLPGWVPERELGIALRANPVVAWFLGRKCPEIAAWAEKLVQQAGPNATPEAVRAAEVTVMRSINDLLVYVVDPWLYDAQPFLGWDSTELSDLLPWAGLRVIDVGAGTGRLALTVAPQAAVVFAVEPVGNLRRTIVEKARRQGLANVYAVDGLITAIPFPDGFADVAMSGHVFGDDPAAEFAEMARVVRPGGWVVFCPGNNDRDNEAHRYLVARGCDWSRFEEPGDGVKRK